MQESKASSFEITCKHPSPRSKEKKSLELMETPISSEVNFFSETSLKTIAKYEGALVKQTKRQNMSWLQDFDGILKFRTLWYES